MEKKTIVRENPTISIITLSKYITSNSKKKESLLKKLKFSDPPLFTRYAGPKAAINKYLQDQDRNVAVFDDYISKENDKKPESSFKLSDKRCSIESLLILKSKSHLFFALYNTHYSKKGLKKQYTHLYVDGVDVSLSPDYALYNSASNVLEGFIKLSFSKEKRERLTYQQGQLITGLIKDHLEEQLQIKLNRRLCIVIDVFAQKTILAPEDRTWIKDKPKLSSAFKEIAAVWPYLQKQVA